MHEEPPAPPAGRRPAPRLGKIIPAAALAFISLSGCFSWHTAPPSPGSTRFGSATVTVPASLVSNTLIVEAKWDRYGPYHFLVDTGSSVTLISPELAARYNAANAYPPSIPQVQVHSSGGGTTVLPATTLTRVELGKAKFFQVPALIYDCSSLGSHLGMKIDGSLGFPFFREARLTLDYLHSRLILRPVQPQQDSPGSTVSFNNTEKSPVIPVRVGDRTIPVLLDSGSFEAFSLNVSGLAPKFAFGPVGGPIVSTLTGDRAEKIGRLAETLYVGQYAVPRPVVDLTDDRSALGGGILKYFTLTFDQARGQVTFFREAPEPIAVPGRRSVGLSFSRTPAYWRVVGIIPGSPADAAHAQPGDLVTRIDGEPVARWDTRRYDQAVANHEEVGFTFLEGTRELEKRMKVVELVP